MLSGYHCLTGLIAPYSHFGGNEKAVINCVLELLMKKLAEVEKIKIYTKDDKAWN